MVIVDVEVRVGLRGGITVYHCDMGWKIKWDLGLNDIFVGS